MTKTKKIRNNCKRIQQKRSKTHPDGKRMKKKELKKRKK
jgi:hypothetical protein